MTKVDLNKNSIRRIERLKRKKIITSLFNKKEGSFFVCSPIIGAYKVIDDTNLKLPQVAFTVSKSKFKHAVDRNRIKRLMRQAYRTNKHGFTNRLQEQNKVLAIMFIYKKNKILAFKDIEKAMLEILNTLVKV